VSPRYPEHLRQFDYVGPHAYFLTFCTAGRQRLFTEDTRVEVALSQIRRAASVHHFELVAYCFMPDHVHLLVEGATADADLRRFIKLAKQCSGFHYRQLFGQALWQRYGFERVLRSDEAVLSVARYIVENPLRARLSQSVMDYPFVGSDTSRLIDICEAIQMQDWYKHSAGSG
jgi:putative transposase